MKSDWHGLLQREDLLPTFSSSDRASELSGRLTPTPSKTLLNLFNILAGSGLVIVMLLGWLAFTSVKQQSAILPTPTQLVDILIPTQTPIPTLTYPPIPKYTIHAYDPQRDTDAECVICSVTKSWQEPKKSEYYQWRVFFPADKPALLSYGWCARDQQTLYENWSSITYLLFIDERVINLSQFLLREEVVGGQVCYFYYGVLTGWEPGKHSVIWIQNLNQELNNGWNIYEPGVYALEFEVELVNQNP